MYVTEPREDETDSYGMWPSARSHERCKQVCEGLNDLKLVLGWGTVQHEVWTESCGGLQDRVLLTEVPEQFRTQVARGPRFPPSLRPWSECWAGARALGAGKDLPTPLALPFTVVRAPLELLTFRMQTNH